MRSFIGFKGHLKPYIAGPAPADCGTSLQALLDMYTIQRELGHLENIRIGLVGDLANGRTARSLAFLLSMYKGIKMYFVAPDVVRMKDDIKSFFRSRVRSIWSFSN